MLKATLCLVLGFLATGAVVAQDASASATIESVSITVVDLTPRDSSGAGLEFVGYSWRAADASAPGIGEGSVKYFPEPWTLESPPFRIEASTDTAFASIASDPGLLSLSAFARSPQLTGGNGSFARGVVFSEFQLSAHTEATFSGSIAIGGDAGATAGSYALAKVYAFDEDFGRQQQAELRQGWTAGALNLAEPFSLTVRNNSDVTLLYGFGQEVWISAGVPAIPEPSAMILLLAGLGSAFCMRVRRRVGRWAPSLGISLP